MSMTDPIADLLCRMRNAQQARHETLRVPSSTIKLALTHLLLQEGYISGVEEVRERNLPYLEIRLRYQGAVPLIQGSRRVSRPGRRVYVKAAKVPRVLGGLGVAILSTPRGIMTDQVCRRQGVGGEVLCYVW